MKHRKEKNDKKKIEDNILIGNQRPEGSCTIFFRSLQNIKANPESSNQKCLSGMISNRFCNLSGFKSFSNEEKLKEFVSSKITLKE